MSNKIDCAKLEEMFGHFYITLHIFSLLVNKWFNSHLETKYVLSLLLTYYENTTASPRGEIIKVYFRIQLATSILINVTIYIYIMSKDVYLDVQRTFTCKCMNNALLMNI